MNDEREIGLFQSSQCPTVHVRSVTMRRAKPPSLCFVILIATVAMKAKSRFTISVELRFGGGLTAEASSCTIGECGQVQGAHTLRHLHFLRQTHFRLARV
jgi:hypothetical protein